MIGLFLFAAVLVGWGRAAWHLGQNSQAAGWIRMQGVLTIAVLVAYAASALFHDLTFSPTEHWLIFLFSGMTIALCQRSACVAVAERKHAPLGWLGQNAVSPQAPVARISLFGISIDRLTMPGAVAQLLNWCGRTDGSECKLVVTPNLDHAVLHQHRADVRAAYADASLVVADGAPLVWASRLFRKPLPERVAGSDLVPLLFEAATCGKRPLRVYLLGAAPNVSKEAAARIEQNWPGVEVVGRYSPPMGFERDPVANERILRKIAAVEPDLLLVGLGAPKQEIWVHAHRRQLQAKVAICAGATIDFLAGHRHRSPMWMRQVGLEWLHRLLTEPRRLAGRYARDAFAVPKLLWCEFNGSRGL
jgi:N-acetylglucosaminyldiphosphoundecaprenol N-acetyl-beta-D-mannosaminyltransferase